jgi:c-di-GMP-binding flagellar brake protein YcgR
LHIRRVRLDIRLIPHQPTTVQVENVTPQGELELVEGRALLNDFSEGGVGIYSSSRLQAGQEIRLSLSDPTDLVVHGKVVWCQDQHAGSPILSAQSFAFRAGVQFVFKSEEEKQSLQKFCDDLRKQNIFQNQPD